jgi:Flp pilus assembly protein TadB
VLLLGAALPHRPRATQRLPGPPRSSTTGPGSTRLGHSARHGRTLALALLAALVAPPLAAVPPAVAWTRTRARALRTRRLRERQVADGLPDTVDLLLLCTGAGWSLPVAHPHVARRVPSPLSDALEAAERAARGGLPRAEALLDSLTPLGERARSLGHVLADHLRYGVALAPGLERLNLELRLDRRRRAEQEARRVPVRLLGPLVLCVLPAFALLTVVPLLAASLKALPT